MTYELLGGYGNCSADLASVAKALGCDTADVVDRAKKAALDAEIIDWIVSHPCDIKWNITEGWVINYFPAYATGKTLREALCVAMSQARPAGAYLMPGETLKETMEERKIEGRKRYESIYGESDA